MDGATVVRVTYEGVCHVVRSAVEYVSVLIYFGTILPVP